MEEQISFQNHKNETLKGSLHRPDSDTQFGVVLGHCFTCSRHTRILKDVCDSLNAFNIMALRFDYSGNGQSEGDFADSTHTKQIEEMVLAAKQLENKGVTWIAMGGHSMGGTIAVLTAEKNDWVKAVVTMGSRYSVVTVDHLLPPKHKDRLLKNGQITFLSRGRRLTLTEAFFNDVDTYQLSESAARLKRPLLIVHGDQDEIVPFDEAKKGVEVCHPHCLLETIPGADHMFSDQTDRALVAKKVGEWVSQQTKNVVTA